MADEECCICMKKKTARTGSGYERLDKCVTENSARTLHNAAASEKFPCLPPEIRFADCETIIAKEYFYHRSCYRKILFRKKEANKSENIADEAFSALLKQVEEKVLNNCEVLRMPDITQLYSEIVGQLTDGEGCPGVGLQRTQRLKEKIQNFFGEKLGFWKASYGGELVFNNNLEKGQLIEVAVKAKIKNQGWVDKSPEDKTTEVARLIRDELLESPNTYSRYVNIS